MLTSHQLPVPVVVVGGISVGGSGKTPMVLSLIDHLRGEGMRPGVISRGYGGNSDFWPRVVGDDTSAELVGDEPQLIWQISGAPVVVGPERVRCGQHLLDRFDCDVIISDDGFQHFALKRDHDLVVVDGEAGIGNGWCLPSGPLREPVSALSRAHTVVVNGESSFDDKLGVPVYEMRSELGDARNLVTEETRPLSEFAGSTINAMAAIGNPDRFFAQLKELGLSVEPRPFPDHYQYDEADLPKSDDAIVMMTEKDGIKCQGMRSEPFARNVWIVPAKVSVDAAVFERVDETLKRVARK